MVSKQCFQFAENGECKFGDNCRFAHGDKPGKVRTRTNRRFGQCNQFRDTGNCEYGDDCKYAHGDKKPNQQKLRLRAGICFDFKKNKFITSTEEKFIINWKVVYFHFGNFGKN